MINLAAIPGILSFIHQVILLVESLFPNAKSGAAKLDAAVAIVQAATGAALPVDTVKNTISGVVTAMNIAGALGGGTATVTNTTVG